MLKRKLSESCLSDDDSDAANPKSPASHDSDSSDEEQETVLFPSDSAEQPPSSPKMVKQNSLKIMYDTVLKSFQYAACKGIMPTPPEKVVRRSRHGIVPADEIPYDMYFFLFLFSFLLLCIYFVRFKKRIFKLCGPKKEEAACVSWIRLYWKFLTWIKTEYGVELMCMASSFLFMVKGGLPKGIRNHSARPICISERNLEHVDKSCWSAPQKKMYNQLVVRKIGPTYDFKTAQENMLNSIIPLFFRRTFPNLDDYTQIAVEWNYATFSQQVPKPFHVRFFLESLTRIMPNICTYALEPENFRAWKVPIPLVFYLFCVDFFLLYIKIVSKRLKHLWRRQNKRALSKNHEPL